MPDADFPGTIDRLTAAGIRCTGFHITLMHSMTRGGLHTGRNDHSGLDVGLDRGTIVTDHDSSGRHAAPFEPTGTLVEATVDLDDDQQLDHDAASAAEPARE